MFATVSSLSYGVRPRICHALPRDSYRERFQKLNQEDSLLVTAKYKKDLTKAFGYSHIISALPSNVIDDLHYIYVLYTKPLSPERRMMLRNKILPLLESADEGTQEFYEHLLKYYEVL